MQIYGPSSISGAQPLDSVRPLQKTESAENLNGLHGADQIDISPESQMIGGVDSVDSLRSERIEQIRQQIAAGVYATEEKLDIAVGRLFDQLMG